MARKEPDNGRRNRKKSDAVLDDILCLRARNVSFRAIAEALEHFRDVSLTVGQVEYACSMCGEAPDPRKARTRREVPA